MQIKMLLYTEVLPGCDEGKYTTFLQKYLDYLNEYKKSGAIVEQKIYKSLFSSHVDVSEIVWRSLEDWAKFWESSKSQRYIKMSEAFSKTTRIEILYNPSGHD